MASRLEKIFWSLMCGAALALGACDNNEDLAGAYGPPVDTATDDEDAEDDVLDTAEDLADTANEEPTISYYGPMPDF